MAQRDVRKRRKTYRTRGKRRERRESRPTGNGIAGRIICSGALFVLLVFGRLLLPSAFDGAIQGINRFLTQDANIQWALEAMGRAVSGENTGAALREACTAVFGGSPPQENTVAVMAENAENSGAGVTSPQKQRSGEQDSASLEQESTPPPEQSPELAEPAPHIAPSAPPPPAQEAYVPLPIQEELTSISASKVYTMPAMPDNASLEQRNLGFPHQSPLQGKLTSPFGWREHPIDGGTKFHYGVDLSGAVGTPVSAFADGEVYAVGDSSTLGKYIMLRHEGEYMTLYAHCSRICVSKGAVSMGDTICEVGDTGRATGPHLHFELHDGGLYLNPIYYVDLQPR